MMKCNKPCDEADQCKHVKPHKRTKICAGGCTNGAHCISIDKAHKAKVDKGLTTAERLNKERGSKYGPAIEEFATEYTMIEAWITRRNNAIWRSGAALKNIKQEKAIRQTVSMCILKLVRAAQSPDEPDHWDDLMGYARCAKLILGLKK